MAPESTIEALTLPWVDFRRETVLFSQVFLVAAGGLEPPTCGL
jgi:hypothetical protein